MAANIDPIVQSLHALLLAAVPHAEQQADQSSRTAAARLRMLGRNANVSPEEARMAALLADPVGAALRQAMRDLGSYLFTMDGSTTLMRYASELLLDMAPAELSIRATLLDQAWHGLGQAQDLWIGY